MDDYTRYTWVFFLVDKSDVFATFKTFIKRIHHEFETTIMKVRSDNGEWMICVMSLELGINFWPSILHNQMA